jgi:hypothetical protein
MAVLVLGLVLLGFAAGCTSPLEPSAAGPARTDVQIHALTRPAPAPESMTSDTSR